MNVLEAIDVLKEMAKEAGTTLEKAISMVEVYERKLRTEQNDRRSTVHERDILQAELAKLDPERLRNATTREIANQLVSNGVPIRPNVQGVLAFISRTRKQLTYQQPTAKAA